MQIYRVRKVQTTLYGTSMVSSCGMNHVSTAVAEVLLTKLAETFRCVDLPNESCILRINVHNLRDLVLFGTAVRLYNQFATVTGNNMYNH